MTPTAGPLGPRPPSLEAADDLADMLVGALNTQLRVAGGCYRLEIASAVLKLIERIGGQDPGFIATLCSALFRPDVNPHGFIAHQAKRASAAKSALRDLLMFAIGYASAVVTLIVALVVAGPLAW